MSTANQLLPLSTKAKPLHQHNNGRTATVPAGTDKTCYVSWMVSPLLAQHLALYDMEDLPK